MCNEQFYALNELLDRAICDAAHWEEVCNEVVRLLGATGAIFVPTNPNFRGTWMSCSTALGQTLEEYITGNWHLHDPREDVTKLMLKSGIATDDDIFPDRSSKAKMPFYEGFLYPHNFGVLSALRILTPDGYWGLMIHFPNDHPKITEEIKAVMRQIRHLLEQAAQKAAQNTHFAIASFARFFKEAKSEVYVLDVTGEQCFSIDNTGKLNKYRKLTDLLPIDLRDALHEKLQKSSSSDPSLSLTDAYQFRTGHQNINLLLIQIPANLRHYFMNFKVCAISTECSDDGLLKQLKLRDNYQLTESEVVTVNMLSSGNTANVIAKILGLKPTTIRQRIKVICEKMQVNSQVELVGLFHKI